ncbi:hypothetical protein [Hydrogenophaga sp. MI9]|uniref:hypothetical protein n=1 Tax=Hydrogenophaga sp. MI9 TaxID=3453719 RepID=UPI003EEAA706
MSAPGLARSAVRAGLTAGALFLLALLLLRTLSFGCDNLVCHPWGYRFGAALLLAGVALALPGWVFLRQVWPRDSDGPGFPLFTSMATGLVLLMAYVYVRSLFSQFVRDVPVSRWELVGLVLVAGVLALRGARQRWSSGGDRGQDVWRLVLELVLLAVVCVVIADRELPRTVLLSSDPDFHVFFGLQVERFGGVPYHQRDWGDQAFNYPAGSGVMLFVWRQLSGLDLRNLLTALPILFQVVAGFVVVEQLMPGLVKTSHRVILLLCSLGMTVGGFLFPLFVQYAHMESGARQMGILVVALLLAWVIASVREPGAGAWRWLVLPVLAFFVLMVLNPAHAALPACVLVALAVYGFFTGRRSWSLLLVLLGGLALGVLDPFYQKMVGYTQGARTDTVIYGDALTIKTLPAIVRGTVGFLQHGYPAFFQQLSVLLTEQQWKVFLSLLVFYAACLFGLSPRTRISRAAFLSLLALLLSMYGVHAFTQALATDIRTFLLAPYIFFNLAQYKALLLIFMAAAVLVTLMRAGRHVVWLVLAGICLALPAAWLVRSAQPMVLEPRRDDCGALGCIEDDDLVLLRKFEQLVAGGELAAASGKPPRVLIPNAVARMELETWIFPVSSARVLPYFKVLPAAFYYFQGDAEYGTAAYLAHVCERLDRGWLQSKGIAYVYLPSERSQACLAGMETLIGTEQVVLNEGGAYLLRLREPAAVQAVPGAH